MAGGKVSKQIFEMEYYDTTYADDWFTLASGLTWQSGNYCTLRHVEKNLWYIYLAVNGTIAANGSTAIGTINEAFFGNKDMSCYVPAVVNASGGGSYPAVARVNISGEVNVIGGPVAGSSVVINGLIIRREV